MHHDTSLSNDQFDAQDYMFLTGERPNRSEVFRGDALCDPVETGKTLQMLSRLAGNLERKGAAPAQQLDNPNIPAGYTYFGQLVAHDLTFEASKLPSQARTLATLVNLNTGILDLDCIYGGGPDKSPHLYQHSGPPLYRTARDKLRLGLTRGEEQTADDLPRMRAFAPHGTVSDDPAFIKPARLNNRENWYETLIADPRNEDNLILSQLVVLFHKLHNKIVDGVRRRCKLARDVSAFPEARELTTAIYREVIKHDYLRVLMRPDIWEHYNKATAEDGFRYFKPASKEPAIIPIEFAVAAKRIGHAMINTRYDFNKNFNEQFNTIENDALRITQLVESGPDGTSAADFVPLPAKWRIEWPRFFPEMKLTSDSTYLPKGSGFTPSRTLRAHSTRSLRSRRPLTERELPGSTNEFLPGLIYHDLARSFHLGLPRGQLMARLFKIDERLTPKEITTSLKRERRRPSNPGSLVSGSLTPQDINILAEDTPLLLYILLEAELRENGLRLGELGSRLMGDVMFGLLLRADTDLSGKAESHCEREFPKGLPKTMREIHVYVGTP